jgi:uncharacterized C2H2 Zn-finger protein
MDKDILGQCNDLIECEEIFSTKATGISLLGDIAHSESDIDKLASLISQQIADEPEEGIKFLDNKASTSISCLLVWIGAIEYEEGKYWPFVYQKLGLPEQNKWREGLGDIFLSYLRKNELPISEKGHRYLASILLHSSIPEHCLPNYFEKILLPIIKHNPADRKEITFLLESQREDYREIQDLEKKNQHLLKQKNETLDNLRQFNSLVNIWDEIERIEVLEKEAGNIEEIAFSPDDPYEHKSRKSLETQTFQSEIEILHRNKRGYEQKIEGYSEEDRKIVACSDEIAESIKVFSELEAGRKREAEFKIEEELVKERLEKEASSIFYEPWNNLYSQLIQDIPFDRLKEKIELFNLKIKERKSIFRIVKEYILSVFGRQREKKAREIHSEFLDMVKNLPIKKEEIAQPQIEIISSLKQVLNEYESLCQVRKNIGAIEEKNRSLLTKIRKIGEIVGIRETPEDIIKAMQDRLAIAQSHKESVDSAEKEVNEIEIRIKEMEDKKKLLVDEIQVLDHHFAKLGEGDVLLGIEELKPRRNAHQEAISIRNSLAQTYPNLYSLNKEKEKGRDKNYYLQVIDQLGKEAKEIDGEIDELDKRLKQIQEPFPCADKPIRRFLLDGGETAKEFFIKSVQMLNQTIEDGMIPTFGEIGLPERIITGFNAWWEGYQEKIKREQADEIITKSDERFRSPVIVLDTAIGEIKACFPVQRLLTHEDLDVCLVMNEEIEYKLKMLYKYSKELVETKNLDFSISSPASQYKFVLKGKNKELRSWSIQGITPEYPFMAFDKTERLIQDEELPKGDVWIVVNKRFALESSQIIEESPLYGKWREYKYLRLDLSNVERLNLVDENGRSYSIAVSKEHISQLILYGKNALEGVLSGEGRIYIGEPPGIHIPIKSESEVREWSISIYSDGESTLTESLHHRLTDLETRIETGICELSLKKYLAEEPVGGFRIRVRNNLQGIDKWFSFSVLPSLMIKFDKEMYLPKEKVCLMIEGPYGMEFNPEGQVRLSSQKDGLCEIEAEASEQSIFGRLKYPYSKGAISVPITIQIPRLMWQIEGLSDGVHSSESENIEEIWFGDWEKAKELYLIVSMPSSIEGEAILALRDSEQQLEARIKEGKGRFDLQRFNDTLRGSEHPVCEFELSLPNSSIIKDVWLFSVRTKWGVGEIEPVQSLPEGMVKLRISWKKEYGKAEGQRVVRLWKIWEPDAEPITAYVSEGAYTVDIVEAPGRFPPGNYRLHIDVEDAWSTRKPSMPSQNALNTIEIEVREEILQGRIHIISVIDEKNQIHSLNYKYSIYLAGKIISVTDDELILNGELSSRVELTKPINKGWYKGDVSVATKSGVNPFEERNPLKLEIDLNQRVIKTAEDTYGEGVYFCPSCKNLFWDEKDAEKEIQRGHKRYLLTEGFKLKFTREEE